MNVTRPSAFVHVACNIFRVEQDMRKAGKGIECEKCKLPTARRQWAFQDDETTNLLHCIMREIAFFIQYFTYVATDRTFFKVCKATFAQCMNEFLFKTNKSRLSVDC